MSVFRRHREAAEPLPELEDVELRILRLLEAAGDGQPHDARRARDDLSLIFVAGGHCSFIELDGLLERLVALGLVTESRGTVVLTRLGWDTCQWRSVTRPASTSSTSSPCRNPM